MADEIKLGDKLRDNDPRMAHRGLLTVTKILPNGVEATDQRGRPFLYLRGRVFTDKRQRKTGLSLVREAA